MSPTLVMPSSRHCFWDFMAALRCWGSVYSTWPQSQKWVWPRTSPVSLPSATTTSPSGYFLASSAV